MGGVCSGGIVVRNVKSDEFVYDKNQGFSGENLQLDERFRKNQNNDASYVGNDEVDVFEKRPRHMFDSGELMSISRELRPSMFSGTPANKAPQIPPSFLGKAGLEKAVDVLDALGSSMTNLNAGGFSAGVNSRTKRIRILAFEVANTIAKGSSLLQSLSEESIRELKTEILTSEGVKRLVSKDMKELLSIAAADKREEFDVFAREVIRFGNLCKDPQWHNLDRFFLRLDSDSDVHKQKREDAEMTMQELTNLAQHTSELYHELHALDRFQLDYRRKLEEVASLNLPKKGDCLAMLQSELKHQRKLVLSMQKKSLWSKTMEQVVEKLVDIVTFIHQDIKDAFGSNDTTPEQGRDSTGKPRRLGAAGLALHYASIITQIDNIASRPTYLPPNMRETLYDGLPPSIKTTLRSLLQHDAQEELSFLEIKANMEKYLDWLAPLAAETTRAHQGFGWVGEWASAGNEFGKKPASPIRLQTLYHADKDEVESCILELLTWLHRLVSVVRYRDSKPLPMRSSTCRVSPSSAGTLASNSEESRRPHKAVLISAEDRILLENVTKRRRSFVQGLSKSQEFATVMKSRKSKTLSRSMRSSPRLGAAAEHKNVDVLDVLDGLDSSFSVPAGGVR